MKFFINVLKNVFLYILRNQNYIKVKYQIFLNLYINIYFVFVKNKNFKKICNKIYQCIKVIDKIYELSSYKQVYFKNDIVILYLEIQYRR